MSIFRAAPLAILSGLSLAGYVFDISDPKVFVRELYAPYMKNDHGYVQNRQDLYDKFDSCLGRLLAEDNQQMPGDVGYLDADPICACQDFDEVDNLDVEQTRQDGSHPIVSATFTNLSSTNRVLYTLVPFGKSWRIYDLSEDGVVSMRSMLLSHYKDKPYKGTTLMKLCGPQ